MATGVAVVVVGAGVDFGALGARAVFCSGFPNNFLNIGWDAIAQKNSWTRANCGLEIEDVRCAGASVAFAASSAAFCSAVWLTPSILMPSIKRLVRESGRPVPRQVATSITEP